VPVFVSSAWGLTFSAHRLLHVLAAGVYVASLVKDSICSPRPYAPPVTRLSGYLSEDV
jgi:hypothetical protein